MNKGTYCSALNSLYILPAVHDTKPPQGPSNVLFHCWYGQGKLFGDDNWNVYEQSMQDFTVHYIIQKHVEMYSTQIKSDLNDLILVE